ncbi:hypothetical protein CDAR_165471 [Caerostris darwini]|uniref:Uncharacterized protein n=1 Tax=Caerostris darwini TaxID=1538125 RepID=A0AAV4W1T7_9ARAC|nr:hypothetical protein CDAR_165471 [Caerostris darwini]
MQSAPEHQALGSGSIIVWPGISLGYNTNHHIFRRGSVTAVRCDRRRLDEKWVDDEYSPDLYSIENR